MDPTTSNKAAKPSGSSIQHTIQHATGGPAGSEDGPQQAQAAESSTRPSTNETTDGTTGPETMQESNQPPHPPASVTTTALPSPIRPSQDLKRFVDTQDTFLPHRRITLVEQANLELRRGRKLSHWIWFVFPQLAGIKPNPSPRTRYFALQSSAEARAYLAHPVLGQRLRTMMRAVLESQAESIEALMGGEVDAEKLRSCVTLFVEVTPEEEVFAAVLEKWFDGDEDEDTLNVLASLAGAKDETEAAH